MTNTGNADSKSELLTPEAADFLYAAGVPLEYHYTHWSSTNDWFDTVAFEHEMKLARAKKLSECVEWIFKNRQRNIPPGTKVLFRVKR